MSEQDEHSIDPQLLQMQLDDCRIEIARLRGARGHFKVQRLDGGEARLPDRAHLGDAGFDLYTSRTVSIEPGEFVDVPCDIAIELPPNLWAQIVGRSSTLRKRGLLINPAVIDQGYRGPIYAGCWNLGHGRVEVQAGERVAQLIPMPLVAAQLWVGWTDQLDRGDRGQYGFGSTGQ